MRLLIHAEIDALAAQWLERASEYREEITHEDDDTDLVAAVRAELIESLAKELSELNRKVETE